jgi:hypothetical protein
MPAFMDKCHSAIPPGMYEIFRIIPDKSFFGIKDFQYKMNLWIKAIPPDIYGVFQIIPDMVF